MNECPQCGQIHPVPGWYQHIIRKEPLIMPRISGAPKTTLTERMVGDLIYNRARKMADSDEEDVSTTHLKKAANVVQTVFKEAASLNNALARANWKMDNAADDETDSE